jgi:hypothetical protein
MSLSVSLDGVGRLAEPPRRIEISAENPLGKDLGRDLAHRLPHRAAAQIAPRRAVALV